MISSPIKKIVIELLRKYADNIENGNSNINIEEAQYMLSVIAHISLSKEEACKFLNLSRSRFDDLVREGRIPKGKKRVGFKELYWYKDELITAIKD